MQIKRSMILAAGYGKRMLPLTETIPKPLIKIGPKTLLERSIELLVKIGIKEIVINIHYLSKEIETDCIELHTGKLSELIKNKKNFTNELRKIKNCCNLASELKLEVHAGHGLDYKTTKLLAKINEIKEFNIGHFIIGESIFYGLKHILAKFRKISNN